MKYFKNILLGLGAVLILLPLFGHAQKKYVPEKELTTESNTINYKLSGKQYYTLFVPSGSVFLYNEWKDGYVKLVNGDQYDHISLKYDILNDELIHINTRSLSMIMLDKSTISEFGFYNDSNQAEMAFTKMFYPKYPSGDYYFNRLYNATLQLVVRHRSLEEETNLYKDRYGMMRNTKFNTYQHYYLVFPDNHYERFKLKRRSFVDLFSENRTNKKEIKRILRRNHIQIRNESETIEAVRLVEEALFTNTD